MRLTSDSEMLWTHDQAKSPGRRVGGRALETSRSAREELPWVASVSQASPQHLTRPLTRNATRQAFAIQSTVPGPAASASPGSPLVMQHLSLLPRPDES